MKMQDIIDVTIRAQAPKLAAAVIHRSWLDTDEYRARQRADREAAERAFLESGLIE